MGSRGLRLLLAAVAVGLCVYVGRDHFGQLERLREARLAPTLAILLLYLAARFTSSESLRAALTNLGYRVRRSETFLLAILVTYTNLAIPRAGLSTPALYLKHRHGVRYAEFGALQFPLTACSLFAIGVVGLSIHGLVPAGPSASVDASLRLVFGAVALVALVSAFVRIPLSDSWDGKIARTLRRLSDSWAGVWQNTRLVLFISSLQMIALLLRALRLGAAMMALGIDVSPVGVLYASLLADLTLFLSITPAGLGVREAAITYGAAAMGTTPELALSAAILDRIVWTVGVIVLAQFGLWRLAPERLPDEVAP